MTPHVNLLCVCMDSILDQYENSWTLVKLVEEVEVPPPPENPTMDRIGFPFHVHIHFDVRREDFGTSQFYRLLVENTLTGDLHRLWRPGRVEIRSALHRVRVIGVFVPGQGSFRVRVEWSSSNDENASWSLSPASWPFTVGFTPEVADSPTQAP